VEPEKETSLQYNPYIVVDDDASEYGRFSTEKAAIDSAKYEAENAGLPFYVARLIGVAKPLAQPVEYTSLPIKKRVAPKKRRSSHATDKGR